MENKTNVMRILDKEKIKYEVIDCTSMPFVSANEVCKTLNIDPDIDFKTLVTIGKSNNYYVFVIPASKTLDLKKAAKAVNEKNIEMIPLKDLLKVTGYMHGGCSPIGMKKHFTTIFDESVTNHKEIYFSAGKVNEIIKISVEDIKKVIPCEFINVTKDN